MPCYDSRRDEHDSGESWIARAERLEKRCDMLTRLLCEAATLLDNYETYEEASKELHEWWRKHKEFDRKRKRKK